MKCAAFKGSGTFSSYMIKIVYIVVGKRPTLAIYHFSQKLLATYHCLQNSSNTTF